MNASAAGMPRRALPTPGSFTAKATTWAARIGYAARGVVYALVGGIALLAAFRGGRPQGTRGAVASLLGEPFGKTLLVLIAIGLLAHAVWRFVQGALDADGHGSDIKAIVIRGGLLASCAAHALLAVYALSLVFSLGTGVSSGGGGGPSAWLMAQPGGRVIIGIIGAVVIAAGIAQFVKAAKGGFKKWLKLSPDQLKKLGPICRIGLAARGCAFVLIGFFLIAAAWNANPQQTQGLGGALHSLHDEPYGKWLIAAAGIGLLCFAAYSFIEAYARRIAMRQAA